MTPPIFHPFSTRKRPMPNFTIDEYFSNLEKRNSGISDQELLDSIRKHGCIVPVVVWKERGILVDGHRRYDACQALGIELPVTQQPFDSQEQAAAWARDQQAHRRNLTPEEISARRDELIVALVHNTLPPRSTPSEHSGDHEQLVTRDTSSTDQDGPELPPTSPMRFGSGSVAKELDVSPRTVKRERKRLRLQDSLPEELRQAVDNLSVKQVSFADNLPPDEVEAYVRKIANPAEEDEYAAAFDVTMELLAAATRSLKTIDSFQAMKPFYTPGVATRVKQSISDAKGALNQIRPEKHAKCAGIGCDLCEQRGWTTKANNEKGS